jgi:hypothetical protein
MSLILLILLAGITGMMFQRRFRSLFAAALASAAFSAVVVQLVGFLIERSFDAFVMVALVTSFSTAFFIALVVGVIARRATKRHSTAEGQTTRTE